MVKQIIPQHVAIIMDGNGRWAKNQGLPRIAGHRAGMNNLKTVAMAASKLGISALTVYAFSTENWKRPSVEVQFLMNLPVDFFNKFMPDLMANQVRILITGFHQDLPAKTQAVCQKAIEKTANNQGMILNFAFNYGSRSDILNAVKLIGQRSQRQPEILEQLDEQSFSQYLLTAQLGKLQDPDLLIRTSGEKRLSNFYLWESAYSEMVFADEYWPDYNEQSLARDVASYGQRERRYGGLKSES
ncbi:isoprenyl transferase [Bombilactobacillus folatiphilus]|uniref:Isoprenyl transferase n=1 Tax=Bombilactobacillus folatiphilus TaxID=2923362 RepID=A0ABY4P7A6_9LACO|nr:isoprenyl transferase [Bombilactobacillus folatiphilus]UQS81588.1 isoprenyl transferase [Bombilactobacillus folatiphilus]